MIIKIDRNERDNFEKHCAIYGCTASFFTIESNPLMYQVEILDGGKEPSLFQVYAIGRSTGMARLEDKVITKKY